MSINSLFWFTANFYNDDLTTTVPDSIGGITRVAVFKFSRPCYYTMLSGDEIVAYGKNNVICTHRLFCDKNDQIKSTDLISVTSLPVFWSL